MSLKQMLEAGKRTVAETVARIKRYDTRPVSVSPRPKRGPISSLDDLRQMMQVISEEKASRGGESFEEFFDFDDDEVDAFEDLDAPAQSRFLSVTSAIARDFKSELEALEKKKHDDAAAALRAEREALKAEIRAEMEAGK